MKTITRVLIIGSLACVAAIAQSSVVREGCTAAVGTDSYACNYTVSPGAYAQNHPYIFKADVANTGAASINLNSIGVCALKKAAGGVTTDLVDNDIRAGQEVEFMYDGTNCQVVSGLGNAGGGGTAPLGAAFWLFEGLPTSVSTNGFSPGGGANGGMVIEFTAHTPTIHNLNYKVAVAGSAGAGIILGVFAAPATANGALGSPLCVSVASGTNATTTGIHSVVFTSGSAVSGGICTLTVGGGYRMVMSSDTVTLTVATYNFADFNYYNDPTAVGDTTRAGYANSVSTGTGSGMAFATLGASFFTTLPTSSNSYMPVILATN